MQATPFGGTNEARTPVADFLYSRPDMSWYVKICLNGSDPRAVYANVYSCNCHEEFTGATHSNSKSSRRDDPLLRHLLTGIYWPIYAPPFTVLQRSTLRRRFVCPRFLPDCRSPRVASVLFIATERYVPPRKFFPPGLSYAYIILNVNSIVRI